MSKEYYMIKTSIKKGLTSSVRVGHNTFGPLMIKKKSTEATSNDILDNIEVGDMILIGTNSFNFLKCSEIQSITNNDDGSIDIETMTSIYNIKENIDD